MLIYVVRHGETNANVNGYLQGWSNDPLNENGRKLGIVTGQGMRGIKFDRCISSPLVRASETAEIILRESGNDIPIEFDDRLKEIHAGECEHKKFRPGEREMDENIIKWFLTDPFQFDGFPGGETTEQVCARTQEFLKELISRDDGMTYLVTTHGFAMRAMLNFLYDDPRDFWHGHVPYNCAVNIIEAAGGEAKLIADDMVYYDRENAVDQFKNF